MAKGKKIVNVYVEWGDLFEKLDDEEAGRLIKHFFRYVNDLKPEAPDRLTDIVFEPMKKQLQRDLIKWEAIRDRNLENGKSGGRPRRAENPNNPVGFSGFLENPKKAVEVEEKVEEKVKENSIIKSIKANKSPRFEPYLDFIENSELRNEVQRWIDYKIGIKDAYKSQIGIEALVKKLLKYSDGNLNTVREIIDNSIANNWKGIFQINKNYGQSSANNQTNGHISPRNDAADRRQSVANLKELSVTILSGLAPQESD